MTDKYDQSLYASFQPSEAKLLTSTSHSQLLTEYPILSSALSNIFPYLLLIDNFLEIVTWTNDDPYQNFILIVLYSVIVMYWQLLSLVIIPILISTTFACLVWSISSIIYDSKFNEKPTIDEVLHTLYNITIRFEMLLRPIQHFPMKTRNFVKAFIMTSLLTPVHILIVKYIIPPQKILWLAGLFMLTYHSPWSFSIRRLLWRSVYIRIFAFYVTGLDIKLDRTNQNHFQHISRVQSPNASDTEDFRLDRQPLQLFGDFKILKKSVISPTQLRQVVLFEVLENERRWFGVGWSKFMLPSDRTSYCYEQSMKPSPPIANDDENFIFPIFENDLYTYLWKWLETNWSVDKEFNKSKSSEGWVYYDNNWSTESYMDGFSKFTRSRKWVRKATLTIDKQDIVYDE